MSGSAAYEIIIGSAGNTKSTVLRYDGLGITYETVAEEDTPGVLDCIEVRYFWVSWHNGLLELAIGSSNGRRLVDWKDDNPHSVNALTLVSGANHASSWRYSHAQGKSI